MTNSIACFHRSPYSLPGVQSGFNFATRPSATPPPSPAPECASRRLHGPGAPGPDPGAYSRTQPQELGRDGLSDARAPAGDDSHLILQQAGRQAALALSPHPLDCGASECFQGGQFGLMSPLDLGRGQGYEPT